MTRPYVIEWALLVIEDFFRQEPVIEERVALWSESLARLVERRDVPYVVEEVVSEDAERSARRMRARLGKLARKPLEEEVVRRPTVGACGDVLREAVEVGTAHDDAVETVRDSQRHPVRVVPRRLLHKVNERVQRVRAYEPIILHE